MGLTDTTTIDIDQVMSRAKSVRWENMRRYWHRFSKNPLSIIGIITVLVLVLSAVFAPLVAPHPPSAGKFLNFPEAKKPPSLKHLCGTDIYGRDILSRIFFGFRYSLAMAGMVLTLVVPVGVVLGLLAGYYRHSWIDTVIMRLTDIFIAVPALVLALAICSVLTPSLFNAMIAVCLMWWPWYTRMIYNVTASLKGEYFVQAAELTGAGKFHILFREILPNCLSPILTKMSLDAGWVILIGASLSYVGLGAQAPTPDLGSMVAEGGKYLPDQWWISIFPAFAIMLLVLSFNLLGDGIRDMFGSERG
ncbi:MAG: ABC transporter permease [Deltaproteobacteria bacterium]|nr:ABC transporter permease [Deltaproteobacteria bacterium]MBW2015306.1 ABC transporter permease [Deltaproteobacteria bacterium]MBW2127839.1 ABC transporter permease [Deltaproteobacteria bacterium]MBW2302123.1 ABC transporter permease [Deltaproteobacteria bacterium]